MIRKITSANYYETIYHKDSSKDTNIYLLQLVMADLNVSLCSSRYS